MAELSERTLKILDEVLSNEILTFTAYLADPMMEGQEGLVVAQAEVDRLQPALIELRSCSRGRAETKPDGWLWRPNATSNKRNFTNDLRRRPYPNEGLFVPVVFAGPEVTWESLRQEHGL